MNQSHNQFPVGYGEGCFLGGMEWLTRRYWELRVLVVSQTVGEKTRACKVGDEKVDDELEDLKGGQVFLPLQTNSASAL